MKRTEVPGGWYVDALPTGELCSLVAAQRVIVTHLGRVPFPANEPAGSLGVLYLRCTNVGGFKFAGQSHQRANVYYEWSHAACKAGANGILDLSMGWREIQGVYQGTNPVIYDHAGTLHINDGSDGSQGFRYVDDDGSIRTGDETYGSPFELSEWSAVGAHELYVGQGHPDSAHDAAWFYDEQTGKHRLVEPGPCTFIRANVDGGNVALAMVRHGYSLVLQTTLDELLALPLVDAPVDPPIVIVPPIDDKPKEKPVSLPDPGAVKAAVARAIARQQPDADGHYTNDQRVAALNEVALQFPNMGLMRKDGEKAGRIGNTTASRDTLRVMPDGDNFGYWSDVFGATGVGLAIPVAPEWKRSDDDRATFIAPVPVKDAPPVVIGDKPPASGSLDAMVASLIAAATAPLVAKIAALQAQIDELKARPVGGGSFTLDGQRIHLVDDAGNVVSSRHDENGSPLKANRDSAGPWEWLTVKQ